MVTGLVVALASPQVALLIALGLTVAGVLGFAAQEPSRTWRGTGRPGGGLIGALRAPGLQTLAGAAFGSGACFGAMEVAFSAYGTSRDMPGLVGWLLALNSAGSAVAGLWYGAHADRLGPVQRAYLLLVCAFGPLMALVAAAPTLALVCVATFICGMVVAPLNTAQNLLAGQLAPPGRMTETFTWLLTAMVVGVSTGNRWPAG